MKILYYTAMAALVASPALSASLTLDADTYVRGGSQANTNGANATGLTAADNSVDSGDFKTYLRFDTSGIAGQVEDAVLTLTLEFVYGFGPSPLSYTVWALDDAEGDNWDVNTMTWNTAVGHNPADYTDMTGASLLGGFQYDPIGAAVGDTMSFMSAAFDTFLNTGVGGDNLVTLIILGNQGRHDSWASMENQDYAAASVTYSPVDIPDAAVPLPASGLLLAGAFAGLATARRTRKRAATS